MGALINFNEKAVLIPPLPDIFDRALWVATRTRVGFCPEWKVKKGDHLYVGQVLCTFSIRYFYPFLKDKKLNIISPVNGVFLYQHNIVSFANNIVDINSYKDNLKKEVHSRGGIAIAVKDHAFVPDTAAEAYKEFYKTARKVKYIIFREEHEDDTKYDETTIENAFQLLLDAPILRPSISDYDTFLF